MIDYDDLIYRGKNKLYKVKCDSCGLDVAYRPRSVKKDHICRSCSAKKRFSTPENNTMYKKKHTDKEKFRKHTHSHINYDDTVVKYTASGNKTIKYRKSCPICNSDMGYHRHHDALRKCIKCQGDINRKNTPAQNKIKASMKANLTSRLKNRSLNKNRKSTFDLVGYTIDELMVHLESKFQPGMTWENYGEWHVDHVVPDSWFNYSSTDDNDFKKSWSLNNLQPMWAKDNLKKSNLWRG